MGDQSEKPNEEDEDEGRRDTRRDIRPDTPSTPLITRQFGAGTPSILDLLGGQLQRGYPQVDVGSILARFAPTSHIPIITKPPDPDRYRGKKNDD